MHLVEREHAMNVEIKDMPALRVATVPHFGSYNRINDAFTTLGQIAGPANLVGPNNTLLAIYHDDPETTPEAELRSAAGVTVTPDVTVPAGLAEQWIPAGRYACVVHVGPYEELPVAWARLMGEWLPKSGHRPGGGASFEIYRNTPADTPNEELRTELYAPLA
jgi:AraC family transcriptional regulator